jgi:hypothetical protein
MPAAGAAIAPDRDQQRRRPPPERLVRQPTDRGVARSAFAAAAAAPLVSFDHPARQHRPVRLNTLPDHLQAELVKATEGRQISAAEAGARGSVVHVEVFQMGGVRTSIFGRPRRLPSDRHAGHPYTLNCEEIP